MSGKDTDGGQSNADRAPLISAVPFRKASDGCVVPLLSERERGMLARIASLVRFPRGATIYREGDHAGFVYNIAEGAVRTFRTLPDGTRHIAAFLFAGDLIGLAEEGNYVNQAEAVTSVAAYRLPLAALDHLVHNDPSLDYQLLLKLSHELRQAQRHGLILARHDALGKIAMFVDMFDRSQPSGGSGTVEISLPMSRSDMADYLGISLAAVSRSFRILTGRNIFRFTDRRHLQIVDRAGFEALVAEAAARGAGDRSEL